MLFPVQHAAWYTGPMLAWLTAFKHLYKEDSAHQYSMYWSLQGCSWASLLTAAPCPLYKVLCQQGPLLLQVLCPINIPYGMHLQAGSAHAM